jgi:uncharacterized membrane protein YphA (DoxX/SURF4 family)
MRKRDFLEKYNALAYKTACRWSAIGALAPPNSWRRVLLGGTAKFVYVNQGVGRFTKLGMPFPAFTADFVGCLEIVGGLLLLLGLLTRPIAVLFLIEMIVAMLPTKISMYLGTSPLPLPPVPPQTGFWAVLHEIRSEYAQFMVVLYLLINGPGKWSIDALLSKLGAPKLR